MLTRRSLFATIAGLFGARKAVAKEIEYSGPHWDLIDAALKETATRVPEASLGFSTSTSGSAIMARFRRIRDTYQKRIGDTIPFRRPRRFSVGQKLTVRYDDGTERVQTFGRAEWATEYPQQGPPSERPPRIVSITPSP